MGKVASKQSGYENLIAKNDYQIRLVSLINEGADHLRTILHDPERGNLPTDGRELYKKLLQFEKELHLNEDQARIVFPNNEYTNSELFDITTMCPIIAECCPKIEPPDGGWKTKTLCRFDLSKGAEIIDCELQEI